MIDIHSHILPEIDDGARALDEALEIARIAAEDGIEQMVCTPHMFNGLSGVFAKIKHFHIIIHYYPAGKVNDNFFTRKF